MIWFYCALIASVLWGLSYSLVERIIKNVNIQISIMLAYLFSFIIVFFYNLFTINIKKEIANIEPKTLLMMLFCSSINAVAVFLINHAIQQKNATYASLIEICYPIFTIIFSYVIFNEVQITYRSAIGGLLILSGIFFVYTSK